MADESSTEGQSGEPEGGEREGLGRRREGQRSAGSIAQAGLAPRYQTPAPVGHKARQSSAALRWHPERERRVFTGPCLAMKIGRDFTWLSGLASLALPPLPRARHPLE
ncbi:hypothetical protein EG329_000403 [Mollisiaceae sp. DMI_Dod_QoI]|nr:hypothetical protein EG329_000403 [Helotiales sp. DMI_Dod_QoI]